MAKPTKTKKKSAKSPSRHIKPWDTIQLWARSAGRCEFNGCNRICYKSPITQEKLNIGERAHIWSFSEKGPRGHEVYADDLAELNGVENLLLACPTCHIEIDADKTGLKYSFALLSKWKKEHEKRVFINTDIDPLRKTTVIVYGSNIDDTKPIISRARVYEALFPNNWYPASEDPINLSMSWAGRDSEPNYWQIQIQDLEHQFESIRRNTFENPHCQHFSLYGFAPIPLLVKFGALITDKPNAETYQLHREPKQSWIWEKDAAPLSFNTKKPTKTEGPPALVIALSDNIPHSRIKSVLPDASIWEFTTTNPNNDLIKTPRHLSDFRTAIKDTLGLIEKEHTDQPIHIFPAMPVSTSIELGRIRMPKADIPWVIYDYYKTKFNKALEIK